MKGLLKNNNLILEKLQLWEHPVNFLWLWYWFFLLKFNDSEVGAVLCIDLRPKSDDDGIECLTMEAGAKKNPDDSEIIEKIDEGVDLLAEKDSKRLSNDENPDKEKSLDD